MKRGREKERREEERKKKRRIREEEKLKEKRKEKVWICKEFWYGLLWILVWRFGIPLFV